MPSHKKQQKSGIQWRKLSKEIRMEIVRTYEQAQGNKATVLQGYANQYGYDLQSLNRYVAQWIWHRNELILDTMQIPDTDRQPYNGYFQIERDDAIVISDIEIPDHDVEFMKKPVELAMKFNIKTLIMAGDVLASDQFSKFDRTWNLPREITYEESLEMAKSILSEYGKWFDEIYWFVGNHDEMVARATKGAIHAGLFFEKVKFSRYRYMFMKTKRAWNYIAHQSNFSKNPLTVTEGLWRKILSPERTKCDVVSTHIHVSRTGYSPDGNNQLTAMGCMRNPELTQYVATSANTHNQWIQEFLMIKNGVHYPMSKNFTDWNFWLG